MGIDPIRTIRYARRYANWRELLRERGSGRNPRSVVLRDGTRFVAPPNVNVARMINGIYFNRAYSPPGFEIGAEDVVIDVGANIGVFSVYAGARTRGPVVAIEPSPENLEFLRLNLEANDCQGVAVEACALSDREGALRLFRGSKGVTHQIFEHVAPGADSTEVAARTLEAVAEKHELRRIDRLKLDCEGAEGLILRGISPELMQRIGSIVMEFHDFASPLQHDELQALLDDAGFSTELRWDGRSTTGLLYARR